jgi:hypothetical protein
MSSIKLRLEVHQYRKVGIIQYTTSGLTTLETTVESSTIETTTEFTAIETTAEYYPR